MAHKLKKPLLIHVTTVPETFGFFRGQIGYLKSRGFEVHAVSSPGEPLEEVARREDIPVHAIEMSRRIAPFADLNSIRRLHSLFCQLKPDLVHAHTSKAGILGVVAARLARVPIVVYGMRSLPFVTASGLKRRLLCWTETTACHLADRVIAVSHSMRWQAIASGFCPARKIKVPDSGSSNGVDAEGRFNPEKIDPKLTSKIRMAYEIPLKATVLGFMGRLVKDKGILELAEAWKLLQSEFSDLYLLLVGPIEKHDPVPEEILEKLLGDSRVRFLGPVKDPVPFYAAMDILVLPTYREGFPNVPLEAAAMELPVVATAVDGCREAVADGVTGLLVPPQNTQALAEAIRRLLCDPERRNKMGQAGRDRVLRHFKPENIWQFLLDNYLELLRSQSGSDSRVFDA